jgi:nitric-oxide synthase
MIGGLRLRPRRRPLPPPAPPVNIAEAEEFLRAYCAENDAGNPGRRITAMRYAVSSTGTYELTAAELLWAVRVAWRHAARCSGRLPWHSLRLRDRRTITGPEEVAAETVAHLREATNRGKIRALVSVFAPNGSRTVNGQVIRYAGHSEPDGSITGDPLNAPLTRLAEGLGWAGSGGRFDILPLITEDPGGALHMTDIPRDAVLEVPVIHPQFGWFADLGLRWYAVPLISDMYLDAGGIRYPCVFNGWYMADSEVGVRDLGDPARYDMLPAIARGMSLDTSKLDTFWRVRAATELAVAVHYSYKKAGVMVTDSQTEMSRFMRFTVAEEAARRPWCADWSWIVPPLGGSTTPAFHRLYPNPVPPLKPGYFRYEDSLSAR